MKAEVRLPSPLSLEQAMESALRMEDKNKVIGSRMYGLGSFKSGAYSGSSKGPVQFGAQSYGSQSSPTSIHSWATGAGESHASSNMSK